MTNLLNGAHVANKLFSTIARLRLLLVMFVTLTVSANAWGATATLPVDYSFKDGRNSLPTGVTQSGLGSDYAESNAPYRLKFDGTNDYLQIQVDAAADKIIFAVKMIGGATTSSFQLQGSSNGTTYTNIQKFEIKGSQNAVINCTTTVAIDASYRYFKFVFTKGSNVGFGTLKITKATVATPSLTATPTSLAFGTVEKGSSVAAKTFSISGSNLTSGNLAIVAPTGYSVSPTSKSVNGTLGATTITVTPNTSTAGTFNGNITISGGGLTSSVTVALTMTVKKKHTVTWIVNGNEYTEGTPTASVYEGAKWSSLTLPTAPNPNDYCGEVFAGWTTTNIGSTGLDKDNDATAIQNLNLMTSENKSSKTNTITDNITFHAVFADYEQ